MAQRDSAQLEKKKQKESDCNDTRIGLKVSANEYKEVQYNNKQMQNNYNNDTKGKTKKPK